MSDFIFDAAAQLVFDEAYRASLAPQVAALLDMQDSVLRMATAQNLASQGFLIDVPIQVWGWNPYVTMALRQIDGFTWVPSALQPSVGYSIGSNDNPPFVPYDPSKPPQGSIKVSVNPVDFPPFLPVPAASTPKATNVVGDLAFGNTYKAGPGVVISGNSVNVFDGEPFTTPVGTFTAKVSKSPFGIVVLFEKS